MPASPATVTWPFMPASPWPGMEQMNARPAAGTSTFPVTVWPGSAVSTVPSANVMSWSVLPVLAKVTGYVPAAATSTVSGVKPRSKASIVMASTAATAGSAAALAAGFAVPAAANCQLGAAGPLQAVTASASRLVAAMMRLVRSMSSSLRGPELPVRVTVPGARRSDSRAPLR